MIIGSQIFPPNYIVPFVKGRNILGKNMPTYNYYPGAICNLESS
jgi:hypothetical protein